MGGPLGKFTAERSSGAKSSAPSSFLLNSLLMLSAFHTHTGILFASINAWSSLEESGDSDMDVFVETWGRPVSILDVGQTRQYPGRGADPSVSWTWGRPVSILNVGQTRQYPGRGADPSVS